MELKPAGEPLRSCLYECRVVHHRLSPKEHRFSYRIFMTLLDLDEIDAIAQHNPFFSRNRWNLYAFYDRDHLPLGGRNVKENVIAYLAENEITLPPGARILLLTLPRVLGYIFNPVSFYFCLDATGVPLHAIAQVGNTFGEMKPFLLREPVSPGLFRLRAPKHFYVSPFSGLELDFDFKVRLPGEQMEIHIDDRDRSARPVLLSALTGRRAALSTTRLAWFTLKYPLLTLRVIALIHWEALRLWLKRLPFHRKTAHAGLQRAVLRPHHSIAKSS